MARAQLVGEALDRCDLGARAPGHHRPVAMEMGLETVDPEIVNHHPPAAARAADALHQGGNENVLEIGRRHAGTRSSIAGATCSTSIRVCAISSVASATSGI